MQSGVRVAEGRRGGVKARQRLLRPKQQDRFGFRFYRVYFAFGSRYRTILACAKREDEPVCSGGRTKVRMSSKRLSAHVASTVMEKDGGRTSRGEIGMSSLWVRAVNR